jgi:hypothetical protein
MHPALKAVHADLMMQLRRSGYYYGVNLGDKIFMPGICGAVIFPGKFLGAHGVFVAYADKLRILHFGKRSDMESAYLARAYYAEFYLFIAHNILHRIYYYIIIRGLEHGSNLLFICFKAGECAVFVLLE